MYVFFIHLKYIPMQLKERLRDGTLTLRDLDSKVRQQNCQEMISNDPRNNIDSFSLQRRGSSKSRKRRNKKRNKASDSRNEGSQELLPQDQPKEKPRTSKNSKRGLEQKENGHSNNSDNQNGQDAQMVAWKEKKTNQPNKQTCITEHSMPFYLSRLVHFVKINGVVFSL
jgi:hypothetical protein